MIRHFFYFLAVSFVNFVIFAVLYFALTHGLMPFTSFPSSGDLKAVYLPLTGFAYTLQIGVLASVILVMNWILIFALKVEGWRAVVRVRFVYTYSIMIFSAAVLANKFDWWVRLVFHDDRFGYYTTRPAAASIAASVGCLGIIYVTISQNYDAKAAVRSTLFFTVLLSFLSVLAASRIAVSIAYPF